MGKIRRETIDEQFPHRVVIPLPFVACSLAMNEKLLVIGSMSGAIFYKIEHLIARKSTDIFSVGVNHEELEKVHVMKSFPVHAIEMSKSFFVGVSGVQIGVWNVERILNSFDMKKESCCATWSATLNCKNRVTCIRLSNSFVRDNIIVDDCKFIALVCWDGTTVLLRREGNDVIWKQYHKSNSPWEHSIHAGAKLSPCFAEILEYEGCGLNKLLVVTTPSSSLLRIFDIENGYEIKHVLPQGNESKSVVVY